MSSDEARLIQQAKERDPSALAEIYDRYQPAIYRYVFYRVDDVATAEELTGEVFVRLVESIDRFTLPGPSATNLAVYYRPQSGRRLPATGPTGHDAAVG